MTRTRGRPAQSHNDASYQFDLRAELLQKLRRFAAQDGERFANSMRQLPRDTAVRREH